MRTQLRAVQRRLGRTVKQLRNERGWSQEELAFRIAELGRRASAKRLSVLESGKANARLDLLVAIAAALEVDILELFAGAGALRISGYRMSQSDVDALLNILKRVKRSRARIKP